MEEKFLLVSDLDGTLLDEDVTPDRDEALARFAEYYETSRSWLTLIYASGRFFDSVADVVRSSPLPEPAAVIGGVGSEIRTYPDGAPMQAWWDLAPDGWSASRVRDLLEDVADLTPQEETFQSDYKQSFYYADASPEQLRTIREKLEAAGVGADLIYSSRRDLDLLPGGFDKGAAAAFLAECWGFDPNHVLVSGNSGNDLALFAQGFRGIVVANAHDPLQRLSNDERVYIANAPVADGVREGIEHWRSRDAGRR